MSFETNIISCHTCIHMQSSFTGTCACRIDGKDIIEHAQQDVCPKQIYGTVRLVEPTVHNKRPCNCTRKAS